MEKEQRPVFGAYLNLARNNMFTTLKYINSKVGVTGGTDDNEAQMFKMSVLTQELNPEQENQALRLFFLHFPFTKYINPDKKDLSISFNTIKATIISCANVLSWWRNIYSHSCAIENISDINYYKYLRENEQNICFLLLNVVTVSARIIKERYSSRNEVLKGMLDDKSMEFITKDRYKINKKIDGGRTIELNKNHFLSPMEDGNPISDRSNPNRLSHSGMVQFICLFLEKKYIMEFLSQIHFLENFSKDAAAPKLSQHRLIFETMSALRIRLPESRLHSEHSEAQVALDILGELKKCPAEIFEFLSAKDKSLFSVKSSTGEDVLLRRSSDRFVPLALSFFDTTNAFPNMRFQINAGIFRYMFKSEKHCIDGKTRMRVLQKPLNGFGRIQEVEKKRCSGDKTIWEGFRLLRFEDSPRNDESCLPYITDTYTRYLLDGNNIGISLSGDYIPDIRYREDGVHYDITCRQADCTISRFDLPALLFYHLLYLSHETTNGQFMSAEELITNRVESYHRMFSDIENGKIVPFSGPDAEKKLSRMMEEQYDISTTDIPEKLLDFLLGKEDERKKHFKKFKEGIIKSMLTETQRRLDIILENKNVLLNMHTDNKPGKKEYVQIKPGNLASFLAKDIVLLQSGYSKLTGLDYSVMQGSMATFSSYDLSGRANLIRMFKEAGLISDNGGQGSHPFLWDVMNDSKVTNTVELYIKYLKARKQYLCNPVPDDAPYLHAGKAKWNERNQDYYRKLAKRYAEQPIALDGSVFEKPVRNILLNLGNNDLANEIQCALKKTGRCNMAYMIQLYQDIVLDDYPQYFYGTSIGDLQYDTDNRLYSLICKYKKEAVEILNELKEDSAYMKKLHEVISRVNNSPKRVSSKKTGSKPSFEEIKDKMRAAYNEYTDTERLIRRLATQDTLLFMAATTIVNKTLEISTSGLKLCQIGNNDEKGILNKRLPKVSNNFTFYWKEDVKGTLKSKGIVVEAEDICIKNYADIMRIVYDRRVASLVHHLDKKVISVEDIKKELDAYDEKRVPVFKSIFEYEDKVLRLLPKDEVPLSPDFADIQQKDQTNSPEDKFAASIIRNSFCHNQYPTRTAGSKQKKVFGVPIFDGDIPEVAKSMARKIVDFSNKTK